jgi:hypothetical protein
MVKFGEKKLTRFISQILIKKAKIKKILWPPLVKRKQREAACKHVHVVSV